MYTLQQGDCLELLKQLDTNSIDAVICDPPAGISFMGKEWDNHKGGKYQWIEWLASIMAECKRVLKPGGHALIWALPRTSHWTANAIEDSGFEVRDRLAHIFGSGFPKNLDISKAIDKRLGGNREIVGFKKQGPRSMFDGGKPRPATLPATRYSGWGTALKPSVEDWWLARKPLERGLTVADNVLKWGTGGLNLDACRVPGENWERPAAGREGYGYKATDFRMLDIDKTSNDLGRFPPNLILSHSLFCTDNECHESCPIAEMDRQTGVLKSGALTGQPRTENKIYGKAGATLNQPRFAEANEGGASRFYPQFRYSQSELNELSAIFHYFPKADQTDRNQGLEDFPLQTKVFNGQSGEPSQDMKPVEERFTTTTRNIHPTVKGIELMSWLCKLVTPKGGVILDPFMGSGSTGKAAIINGFSFIGFELQPEYFELAQARIKWANSENGLFAITGTEE